jgi:hypothetical protein
MSAAIIEENTHMTTHITSNTLSVNVYANRRGRWGRGNRKLASLSIVPPHGSGSWTIDDAVSTILVLRG